MIKKLVYIVTIALLFAACSGESSKGKWLDADSIANSDNEPIDISDEAMESIVQNIASPVEMAALIKSLGVPFSRDYLASTNGVNSIETSQTKALNLGLYAADLGYINMYNRQGMVLDYISAIKTLADGINVGQFFDFSTLKRLASNSQNIDSMMYISVHSFNKMDNYLRKNKRGNLSTLMIAGVWIEGLYLGTQVAKANPTEKLAQTIGEQKTLLVQLMLLLEVYKKDDYVAKVGVELKKIKRLYDDIKITIEVGDPESIIENGKLTIIQHEKSTVHISDEQLNEVIRMAAEIRTNIMSLK